MKAMRNQPRKMAPMGMATAHAGAMLLLLMVANPTANAVTDTVKKNFGNLVISRSLSFWVYWFTLGSMCRLEKGENLFVFLGGQVGAHAHMEHDDFPLSVAVGTGRAEVMAMAAVLGPHFSPTLLGRLSRRNGRFIRRGGLAAARPGSGASND